MKPYTEEQIIELTGTNRPEIDVLKFAIDGPWSRTVKTCNYTQTQIIGHRKDTGEERKEIRDFTCKNGNPLHDDLLWRLNMLAPHFLLMLGLVGEHTGDRIEAWIKWEREGATRHGKDDLPGVFADIDSFNLTGFTWAPDSEYFTLTGRKELEGGKVLNLVSPAVCLHDETFPYAYWSEFAEDFENLRDEVVEWVLSKKWNGCESILTLF